jgi:hypothetical protein
MPLTAAELGELYYSTGGSDSFWEDLINPYLEYEIEGDTGQGGLPGVTYYGQTISFEDFWDTYGDIMPQDYDLGPADIERAQRLEGIDRDTLDRTFALESAASMQSLGQRGFSGGGYGGLDDLWSRYTIESANLTDQANTQMQGIFANQGQAILDQLEELAYTTDVFLPPEDVIVDAEGDIIHEGQCTCPTNYSVQTNPETGQLYCVYIAGNAGTDWEGNSLQTIPCGS